MKDAMEQAQDRVKESGYVRKCMVHSGNEMSDENKYR